jgi:hypothetical protein
MILKNNKRINKMNKYYRDENSKKLFIIDVDDTLFLLRQKWLYKAINNEELVQKVPLLYLFKEIEKREKQNGGILGLIDYVNEYYLDVFLKIEDEELRKKFLSLYIDDPNFYDDIELTFSGEGIKNIMYSLKNNADYIFLSYVIDDPDSPCNISKKNKIIKFCKSCEINENNYNIFFINKEEKTKANFIYENFPYWGLLIEDNPIIINEIIEKTEEQYSEEKLFPHEKYIWVPIYGYNSDNNLFNKEKAKQNFIHIEYMKSKEQEELINHYGYFINFNYDDIEAILTRSYNRYIEKEKKKVENGDTTS